MSDSIRRVTRVFSSSFLIILIWELVRFLSTGLFNVPAYFTPSSISIISHIPYYISDPSSLNAVGITTGRVLFCLFCVTLLGSLFGFGIGRSTVIYNFLRPAWDFLRSVPPSSLFPVFVILLGVGSRSKIVISIYFAVLILSLNVADAISNTGRFREKVWRYMGSSTKDVYLYLIIPQVLKQVISGMRVVASIVVGLVIITEMFIGTSSGLGGLIIEAQQQYNFISMYAAITIAGLLGYIVNITIDLMSLYLSNRFGLD